MTGDRRNGTAINGELTYLPSFLLVEGWVEEGHTYCDVECMKCCMTLRLVLGDCSMGSKSRTSTSSCGHVDHG